MKNKELVKLLKELDPEAEVLFNVEGFKNESDFDMLFISAIEELKTEEGMTIVLHSSIPFDMDINLN